MPDETSSGAKIVIIAAVITAVGAIIAALITILPDVLARPEPTFTPAPSATPEPTATAAPTLTPTPEPTFTPTITLTPTLNPAECDCSRELYNCGSFTSREDAQACFDHCMEQTGQDVHRLDTDKDGEACDSYSYGG